ncbi:MAG: LytTR family transcriptional regulator DNA-binding domain-containing protein [Bacteroidales bacterium]|nr:LytTR family transcriptional regulator DNA-binding domain-containing protein [Bacteroidales bacterium]
MEILIFRWRDELIKVNTQEIVYFKADGNYSIMVLSSQKEQLLAMNLSKVQLTLEEQLGKHSILFERVGRDLIIRKSYLFTIQILKKRLTLAVPGSEKFFELHISKDALKKLKESQELKPSEISEEAQLRDSHTRRIYPLKID